jgi:hypothetical protein
MKRLMGWIAGAALAAVVALPALAEEGALCARPQQMQGFKTCADTVKANEEGEVVIYSTSPEAAAQKMLALFRAQFPKIKTNYVRLQAGALYAKVLAERQAKSYLWSTRCRFPTWAWCSISRKRAAMSITSRPRWRPTRKRRKASPKATDLGRDRSGRIAFNPNVVQPPIAKDLAGSARPEMEGRGQRQGVEFRAAACVVV